MARISVVVPIHRVEHYLAECLQSVARQSFDDLEVIMVDDGSPDDSVVIAGRFAEFDRRFRLIRQPNRGLGAARNRGVEAARGEYLAFVDSDDVLPRTAYADLIGALERTGSDFASGGVRRLEGGRLVPARFLTETFATTRLKTHVTRFAPLLADRTAWNKLWRRSFWDEHALAFPEGVVHEDIPLTIPAHYRARTVDVLSRPVYHWRTRDEGGASITQRRLEHGVLLDRLAAVEGVYAHLVAQGPPGAADDYRRRLVRDDLRLHLDLLDEADADYRELFVTHANALLKGTTDRIFDPLPAIDRLKWHLVRRGLAAEAAEVVRFHKHRWPTTPVRGLRRWYGDYPFRGDPSLRIPSSVYRLGRADADLSLDVSLDGWVEEDGQRMTLVGRAAVAGFGARAPGSHDVRVQLLPPGRLQRLRARTRAGSVATRQERAPGAGERDAWSGFAATFDTRVLGGLAPGDRHELCVSVRAGRLRRRRNRFVVSDAALRPAVVRIASGALVVMSAHTDGSVRARVRPSRASLVTYRRDGDMLILAGDLTIPTGTNPRLEAVRRNDDHILAVPLELDDYRSTFRARLPLGELLDWRPSAERIAGGPLTVEPWDVSISYGGGRVPVIFPSALPGDRYLDGAFVVGPGLMGELVVERHAVPVAAPSPAVARTAVARS